MMRRRRPTTIPHGRRFSSSLKLVEDRLASEEQQHDNKRKKEELKTGGADEEEDPSQQSSSPLFLDYHRPTTTIASGEDIDSRIPLEFLSNTSSPISTTATAGENPSLGDAGDGGIGFGSDDDIEKLMGLLGLSTEGSYGSSGREEVECCCSGGGFYSRIAGVKGPKCEKERRRLDAWIEHYGEEKREPARLAHLLLAKAVFLNSGAAGAGLDFGEIEFPSTVHEYLEKDPTKNLESL